MFTNGDEIWFYSEKGAQHGYIEKINDKTVNVLVNDSKRKEGYQLWRVTEFFLAKSQEEAKIKWDDYKYRLKEYKKLLAERRRLHEFYPSQDVFVNSLSGPPYNATVLGVNKICLHVQAEDGRFMKVDKAICDPLGPSNNFWM